MKSTGILVKTSALILGFTLVLGVGILSLSFSHGGARRNEDTFLTPEHAVAPPTAQELLQKKFEVYNTVTEEDGKSVVTIFSEEQIEDIRTRRENGEWFWLSSEEMLYLINDTVKLFEEYDVVRVNGLNGAEQEYETKTQDFREMIFNTILARAETLNSAVHKETNKPIAIFTDLSEQISLGDMQELYNYHSMLKRDVRLGRWDFKNDSDGATIFYSDYLFYAKDNFTILYFAPAFPINNIK